MLTVCHDVFLSYNSADQAAVEVIARRLREDAGLKPFLDRWHLVPGEPWQEALERALDQSRSCAVFLGSTGFGPWENEEMRAALDIRASTPDFRVIPVLLPGARLLERGRLPRFLARLTWVDFRAGLDDTQAFHALVSGIRGVAPDLEAIPPVATICPFRGLEVFEEQHAEFFFGREALIQHLVEQLRVDRFLAVSGPSGSGKSSLVRAGLVPQVRGGALPGSDEWRLMLVKPGPHPLETLAMRLLPHLGSNIDPLAAHQSLLDALRRDERGLHKAVQAALSAAPDSRRLLLIVDQFEELFTLCHDEFERRQFIANLLYAVSIAGGQTISVITMRADFLSKCAVYPDLAARLKGLELVGPMDPEDVRRAMLGPAEKVGLHYDKGLVEMILNDLGSEPGNLPLLQHTLLELCERRRGDWLTTDAYHAIGGVRGALAQRADTVYSQLEARQQMAARRILLRLTQPGEGTEDTRRRATLAELLPSGDGAADVEAVVRELAKERLLTMSEEERGGKTVEIVDVAHEALIRGWPLLQGWIDADRVALRTHRQITEAAEAWEANNQDVSYFYRGVRLDEAQEWRATHGEDLNELERTFLDASVASRDAEQRAARRRVQWIIAGLLAGLVVVSLLAALSEVRRRDAEEQASRLLAGQALNLLDVNYDLALLLAIEAGRMADPFEVEEALHKALAHQSTIRILAGHTGSVRHAAWNSAGTRIATVGDDGTARVWNLSSTTEPLILTGHTGSVGYVAWSDDDTRLVTASTDGTARVWDAANGAELFVLKGHAGLVYRAAWNKDSMRIVTASADGTARVWDAANGAELAVLEGHGDLVYQAAWSPDGSRIVTVGDDGTARVWDAASGVGLAVLKGHSARVVYVAWDHGSTHVVTASYDGTARVWDVEGDTEPLVLKGHRGNVEYAAWNSDSTRIVTASADSTARVWDAANGAELAVLSSHSNSVAYAAWNGDGTRIVTASADGTARVWDGEGDTKPIVLSGHSAGVLYALWNPDGTRIVTASADGTARVWDIAPGGEVSDFHGHTSAVYRTMWSPDNRHIVTASADGTARVWDAASGAPLIVLSGHAGPVYSAAWNDDGTRIVTASADGTARVWDAASGTEQAVLSGHTDKVVAAAWNGDGTRIVTASWDRTARVWDATGGTALVMLTGHDDGVLDALWNLDGTRIVTASADGTARVWDANGGQLAIFSRHSDPIVHAAWNRDGTRIATASADGTARVWDAANGAELAVLSGHADGIEHVAWNSDSTRIVTASEDGTARVWDAGRGTELAVLSGHGRPVRRAVWSPDDTRIVTAGLDDMVRLWDAASGVEVAVMLGHSAGVLDIAWNAAGTRIATAGLDGTARMYYVRLGDLLAAACQRAVRTAMTEPEWRRYMGARQYQATCPARPGTENIAGESR